MCGIPVRPSKFAPPRNSRTKYSEGFLDVQGCLVHVQVFVVHRHRPFSRRLNNDDRNTCCQTDMFPIPSWSTCNPFRSEHSCTLKWACPFRPCCPPKNCSDTQSRSTLGIRDTLGWSYCRTASPGATFVCTRGRSSDCSLVEFQSAVPCRPSPTRHQSRCHTSSLLNAELRMQFPFPFRAPLCTPSRASSSVRCLMDRGKIGRTFRTVHHERTRTFRNDKNRSLWEKDKLWSLSHRWCFRAAAAEGPYWRLQHRHMIWAEENWDQSLSGKFEAQKWELEGLSPSTRTCARWAMMLLQVQLTCDKLFHCCCCYCSWWMLLSQQRREEICSYYRIYKLDKICMVY